MESPRLFPWALIAAASVGFLGGRATVPRGADVAIEDAADPPAEFAAAARGGPSTRRACKLISVTDGDTIVVDLHVGRNLWQHGLRVRLAGIDAPELPTPEGKASRDALAAKLAGQAIEIEETGADKYGRVLARVVIANPAGGEIDVNAWLIEQGHAREYAGGKR